MSYFQPLNRPRQQRERPAFCGEDHVAPRAVRVRLAPTIVTRTPTIASSPYQAVAVAVIIHCIMPMFPKRVNGCSASTLLGHCCCCSPVLRARYLEFDPSVLKRDCTFFALEGLTISALAKSSQLKALLVVTDSIDYKVLPPERAWGVWRKNELNTGQHAILHHAHAMKYYFDLNEISAYYCGTYTLVHYLTVILIDPCTTAPAFSGRMYTWK